MERIKREHFRERVDFAVVLYWEGVGGQVGNSRPKARDVSPSGMRLESEVAIPVGTDICIEAPRYQFPIEATVRYCVREDAAFRIGVEFSDRTKESMHQVPGNIDYYEVLQLSPKADLETIHRVYRIMASRYHPDNADSGDQERFLLLTEAYRVLSTPELRAQYDALRGEERHRPLPLFQANVFIDEKQGEINRRLGVLCLLYAQRRRNPEHPSISLLELEELMGIPREYLEFTLWYIKQKRYIEMNQGADFSLTADGVDFVEENTPAHTMLRKLLHRGPSTAHWEADQTNAAYAAPGHVQ